MNKKIISLIIVFGYFSLNIVAAQNNALTAQEKKEGWKLLFNGKKWLLGF